MLPRRRFLALATALAAGPAFARGSGLRLIMAERPDCVYCRAWRSEVGPGYAASPEGRAAPLLPVPIEGPWPDGLALDRAPRETPTFILVRGGSEIGRFEGYDDPATFRADLRALLARA